MRSNWLDIAKGITIVLMVLGHSSIPHYLSDFIWAFHMPLFFIASGWSTNWTKMSFNEYFTHRTKTLIIPFCTYTILVCLILCNHSSWKGLVHLLSFGWEGYPLWFIPVLYFSSILCRAVYVVQSHKLHVLLMLLLVSLGVAFNKFGVDLPWTMSSVPYASFLMIGGHEFFRQIKKQVEYPNIWMIMVFMMITTIVSLYCRLDMAWNRITPVIVLTVGAVSGTLMIFILSSLIDKKYQKLSNLLSSIGKQTYVVVAFSSAIIMMINQYLTLNKLLKYFILTILLYCIVKIKNKIDKNCKIKLL